MNATSRLTVVGLSLLTAASFASREIIQNESDYAGSAMVASLPRELRKLEILCGRASDLKQKFDKSEELTGALEFACTNKIRIHFSFAQRGKLKYLHTVSVGRLPENLNDFSTARAKEIDHLLLETMKAAYALSCLPFKSASFGALQAECQTPERKKFGLTKQNPDFPSFSEANVELIVQPLRSPLLP